ncbi:MAG TPA: choice-of-anchor Q domain-containing protein, partial [Fimbriimonas sp.]
GALVYRSDGAQTAMVDSCTFVGNAATVHSGGIRIGQGLLSIRNTIVANNAAPIWADVDGVFTSLGHNLIRSIDGSTGWAPSDKLGVDPLVGPLADNGGPTLTHALRVGSPALDSADPFQFPLTDQRGASRPKGPLPDIGAYEKAVPQNQPPVADAGPDQSLPYYGSPVTATLDGTGSSDPEGLPLGYTWYDEDGNVVGTDPTVNLDLGAGVHTFRLVVEDAGGLTDEDDVAIEVVVVDEPPVADAGPDQSFLYSGSTVSVTLDGSGSIDPEGGALLYAWYDGNGVLVGNEATVDLDLGPGAHTFRLVVEDEAGQTDEDEVVILHQDPAAPTITGASASPTSLWPPNHKMRTIRVSYAVSDDFDTSVTTWLTVESSEADSGLGSGDVPNDVRVVDANTLLLRAERFAKAGRTYTITIHAMDDSGHETIETLKVQVPHSNKKPKKTRR